MNTKYYITTGLNSKMFTLRYCYSEQVYFRTGDGRGGTDSRVVERDYHIRNLTAKSREIAISKAKAYFKAEGIDQDVIEIKAEPENEISQKRDIDWNILQFGKHAGKTVEQVNEEDHYYLLWVAENMSVNSPNRKTIELILNVLEPELTKREKERELLEAQKQARRILIADTLKLFADRLADGKNGFRDSISSGMLRGEVPCGRALSITLDILAKQAGGRNSKAYGIEFDRIASIFEATV